jgi:D-tyrosyl-tRNA(Tyr) deacylase
VAVDGAVVGRCGVGLLVLVAAHRDDTEANADKMADRVAGLRIFGDGEGKMNLSLADVEGSVLAISNFTLYGDANKNLRPSFIESASYADGERLYEAFVAGLLRRGVPVETGVFGAHMDVSLVNDGPVTIVLDA